MTDDKVHLMSFSFFDQSKIGSFDKFDAAKRQLIGAIRFHFQCIDQIIVYQIAANSQEILSTLLKERRQQGFEDHIMNESGKSAKWIHDQINGYRNFAKHADRNPYAVMDEVRSDECESLLFMAASDLITLEGKSPVEVQVFYTWYCALYPDKIRDGEVKDRTSAAFPEIESMSRAEQLEMGMTTIKSALNCSDLLNDPQTDTDHLFRWEGK